MENGKPRPQNPAEAFKAIIEGNRRFSSGTPAHPRQGIEDISTVAQGQRPFATLFGCADSRLSAEIIFDVGLGDLFVVRNAGQVIGETILGSLEFSVGVLNVPLILVLGHDNCGAIRATMDSIGGNPPPIDGMFITKLVNRLTPTVIKAYAQGSNEIDDVLKFHIESTVAEIMSSSSLIAKAVAEGKVAVVGAKYSLSVGEVHPIVVHGNV